MTTTLVKRFVSKCDTSGSCWLWTGCCDKQGYGRINAGGKHGHSLFAHRVSWQIFNGDIPSEMCVCHSCDNPRCVNPDHLFIGTHSDNMKDCESKHRRRHGFNKGEVNGQCKLSDMDVAYIRIMFAEGYTQADLSRIFNVSPSQVYRIVRNKERIMPCGVGEAYHDSNF